MSEYGADLELMLRLADLADEITLGSWRSSDLSTRSKADGSPVTSVDIEVEQRIRDHILGLHPRDGFVSEELGETVGATGRCWYVDGVDGTRAYAGGRREWSTLIAFTDLDGLSQGLCTGPALGKRWYVGTDGRAVKAGPDGGQTERVQVSGPPRDGAARVACWPPARQIGDQLSDHARNRLEELTAGRLTRPSWGAGVPNSAMLVAEGSLDGFVLIGGGPWDHAAAAAIVAAAGGEWSDLSGHRFIHSSVMVLTNGFIHDWLLGELIPPS